MNKITPQDCLNDIHNAISTHKDISDAFDNVARFENIPKEMFKTDEEEMAYSQMIDNEIDDAIQAKHEKLANKAWEDTEGEHPECHGDSPNQNMIGDPKK